MSVPAEKEVAVVSDDNAVRRISTPVQHAAVIVDGCLWVDVECVTVLARVSQVTPLALVAAFRDVSVNHVRLNERFVSSVVVGGILGNSGHLEDEVEGTEQ